jgi:hypothetical protein
MALPQARTLTLHSGTVRAEGLRKKATPAAMLHLLTLLMPPGRTSHYGADVDNDLRVQLYLDEGDGPAMIRVALEKSDKNAPKGDETARDVPVTVTIQRMPDNCVQDTAVAAAWPDGTHVEVDVATCLPGPAGRFRPAGPALTVDQAIRVAADPRWGVTMDENLVAAGAKRFPRVPVLG